MAVGKTNDMEAVGRICNHPEVYRWVSDDSSISPYMPDPEGFYLMNEDKTGMVRIDALNGVSCMIHIATLPEIDGGAGNFAKDCIDWAFSKTQYSKIIALAPACNRAVVLFGKRCGFKVEGRITRSFLKDWVLYDQIVFGLSKYDKEALCQKQ